MIMSIKKGVDRHQIGMYCLEEQVSSESEARVIEAFVEFLDLTKYKFETKGSSKEGQPAYAIKDLLKLYFYGQQKKEGIHLRRFTSS